MVTEKSREPIRSPLVNPNFTAKDNTALALYQCSPFGELLSSSGSMAAANPFRFSTKYQDDETGLLYYGYRYYSPATGKWLSRDPIGEGGGENLYAFIRNKGPNRVGWLGFCILGEITGIKCRPHVSHWLSDPYNDKKQDDLIELIDDVETFDKVISIIDRFSSKSIKDLVDLIVSDLLDANLSPPDTKELAKCLKNTLNEAHGNFWGWYLYTRIEYKTCESCWFGLSTTEKQDSTAWKKYIDTAANGIFDDRMDAYRATQKVCKSHLRQFKTRLGKE
jgi:RHS repeat-associated protein